MEKQWTTSCSRDGQWCSTAADSSTTGSTLTNCQIIRCDGAGKNVGVTRYRIVDCAILVGPVTGRNGHWCSCGWSRSCAPRGSIVTRAATNWWRSNAGGTHGKGTGVGAETSYINVIGSSISGWESYRRLSAARIIVAGNAGEITARAGKHTNLCVKRRTAKAYGSVACLTDKRVPYTWSSAQGSATG